MLANGRRDLIQHLKVKQYSFFVYIIYVHIFLSVCSCLLCLVFLLIIVLQVFFLSSRHSSNQQILCGLSSFCIIFVAASFIPFWILFHMSFISSTSTRVFCTFAVNSLMSSSYTSCLGYQYPISLFNFS